MKLTCRDDGDHSHFVRYIATFQCQKFCYSCITTWCQLKSFFYLQFEKPKLSSKVRKVKRNTKKESCVGNILITNFKDNSEHELNLWDILNSKMFPYFIFKGHFN